MKLVEAYPKTRSIA